MLCVIRWAFFHAQPMITVALEVYTLLYGTSFSRMPVTIYTTEIKGAAVPTLVSHLSPETLEVCVG